MPEKHSEATLSCSRFKHLLKEPKPFLENVAYLAQICYWLGQNFRSPRPAYNQFPVKLFWAYHLLDPF